MLLVLFLMGCGHSKRCVIPHCNANNCNLRLIISDGTEETEHHKLEFLLITARHQGLPNCRNVYKIIYQIWTDLD
ncbi:uncharacterized protein BKA55DRAFT_574375 [Fusarium redolens]|uniref:Uncharacterized protein n=1 Tax=Fusarium redolens TaxID=48865 RepID=A0A9P9JZC6_FUSRE|nr:uncharacterized protein BKA55DRAFT_574375 [Fusarium redolens]KAH7243297.1 hypothetical protein BKA55DRAFT_574375 [Fusarium redolens]